MKRKCAAIPGSRFHPFSQKRMAESAGQFLDGLLGNEPRKPGWIRAEAAGDPGPWRQQAILGRGRWEADALSDIVREYALETLTNEEAVVVIDETGFLKQGKTSCGVARQYTSVLYLLGSSLVPPHSEVNTKLQL